MHPVLFQIGPLTVYSYGVMLAAAILVCSWLLGRDAQATGINRDLMYDLVFWVIAGGILFARIFYVAITWDYFSRNPAEIIMIHHGGLAWQGGFVGGVLGGIAYVQWRKLPLRVIMDLAAPYIALGQSIGRIGCFLNGCCYGKPWDHGIYCPLQGDKLYPTQLFETAALFGIFWLLKAAQRRPHPPGMVFVYYLWLAAIERFAVEFFRGDEVILWPGLSLAQYVAAAVFIAGILVFVKFKK